MIDDGVTRRVQISHMFIDWVPFDSSVNFCLRLLQDPLGPAVPRPP